MLCLVWHIAYRWHLAYRAFKRQIEIDSSFEPVCLFSALGLALSFAFLFSGEGLFGLVVVIFNGI